MNYFVFFGYLGPGCKTVSPPNNGLIYPSHGWAVLHFYCKSGFELHGPSLTYCNGTKWSSNMPICLGKYFVSNII